MTGDLGREIRDRIRRSVIEAVERGPTSVAAAVNLGRDGQSANVYSDDETTIVERNGQTQVFHHRPNEDE